MIHLHLIFKNSPALSSHISPMLAIEHFLSQHLNNKSLLRKESNIEQLKTDLWLYLSLTLFVLRFAWLSYFKPPIWPQKATNSMVFTWPDLWPVCCIKSAWLYRKIYGNISHIWSQCQVFKCFLRYPNCHVATNVVSECRGSLQAFSLVKKHQHRSMAPIFWVASHCDAPGGKKNELPHHQNTVWIYGRFIILKPIPYTWLYISLSLSLSVWHWHVSVRPLGVPRMTRQCWTDATRHDYTCILLHSDV